MFGAFKFNKGNWYEAQTLGGGQPVSVVPFFMGSDATVARTEKHHDVHVSLSTCFCLPWVPGRAV